MDDIRDVLFKDIAHKLFYAEISSERDGRLSGIIDAMEKAQSAGVKLFTQKKDGDTVFAGEKFAHLTASPKQIAITEETVIGALSKTSGIASAVANAVALADGKLRIVSGSTKKMPAYLRLPIRNAIASGGGFFRICDEPMIYLDKNFIKMLGSIPNALAAANAFPHHLKVVQIRGEDSTISQEVHLALNGGCDILMVDTGNIDDALLCRKILLSHSRSQNVKIAFAGCVKIADIPNIAHLGINILCIGKEIVDAPLLDMKLDVIGKECYFGS